MRKKTSRLRASAEHAFALLSTTLAAAFALRRAFVASAVFMIMNNLLFFTTWWILLRRFEHIGGWKLEDVMCLFGISASGFGLAVIVAGGVLDLAQKVHDGELDTWLTQPKSVLLQALCSRTQTSGWGDLASGLGMLALSGRVGWSNLPLAALGVACAFCTFIASGVVAHSLAFW